MMKAVDLIRFAGGGCGLSMVFDVNFKRFNEAFFYSDLVLVGYFCF